MKIDNVDSAIYRDAMSCYAGHVQLIACEHNGKKRGVTVTAACSVSDDPPIVLVCLNNTNEKNQIFMESGTFAVNSLSKEQQHVADDFAGLTGLDDEARFKIGHWKKLTTGAPILDGSLASFDCELVEAKQMGTHMVLFGRVVGVELNKNDDGLLYFHRGYRTINK